MLPNSNYADHHLTKMGQGVHMFLATSVPKGWGTGGFRCQLSLHPHFPCGSLFLTWGWAFKPRAQLFCPAARGNWGITQLCTAEQGVYFSIQTFTDSCFQLHFYPNFHYQFLHLLEVPGFKSDSFLVFLTTGLNFLRLPETITERPATFQVPVVYVSICLSVSSSLCVCALTFPSF